MAFVVVIKELNSKISFFSCLGLTRNKELVNYESKLWLEINL